MGVAVGAKKTLRIDPVEAAGLRFGRSIKDFTLLGQDHQAAFLAKRARWKAVQQCQHGFGRAAEADTHGASDDGAFGQNGMGQQLVQSPRRQPVGSQLLGFVIHCPKMDGKYARSFLAGRRPDGASSLSFASLMGGLALMMGAS